MNFKEAMDQLEEFGTEQNRKVYGKHGVKNEMFGVSYANLATLGKKIKVDHKLATQLWNTKNHDAQILATMIADPVQMEGAQVENWADDLDNYVITDAFAKLVKLMDPAKDIAEKWIKTDDEWRGSVGWQIISALTAKENLDDKYFETHLKFIETKIHKQKNRVRYAMNGALINIGARSEDLEEKALTVAEKIGEVKVMHGETGCKTPDAAEYISKVKEHKKKAARV